MVAGFLIFIAVLLTAMEYACCVVCGREDQIYEEEIRAKVNEQ